MKNQVFQTGNTFDNQSFGLGHARKVWRQIYKQDAGDGKITNVSDFVSAGLIRAGMAVVEDTAQGADAHDYKVLPWSTILAAITGETPAGIDSLGIIGFLQEDVRILNGSTVGTITVIYEGELYDYMCGDTPENAATISAAFKNMTQKNGMQIRIVKF